MRNNAAQLKEAPAPDFRQVFRDFREATAALLDYPVTPDDVRDQVLLMVEGLGDEHDGDDDGDGDLARKVLTRVFGLEEAEEVAADFDDDCIRNAAAQLANAFATIEEYRRFIPPRIYKGMDDCMSDFYSLANWTSDPDVLRKALPYILDAAILKSVPEPDEE